MSDGESHFLRCGCGAAVPFSASECGLGVTCPACDAKLVAPPLSTLKNLGGDASAAQRPIGLSLQSLIVVTAVWGLICYGVLTPRRTESPTVAFGEPIDRSWAGGSLSVDHRLDGPMLRLVIRGEYPDASTGLQLKYAFWLMPEDDAPLLLRSGCRPLTRKFEHANSSSYLREARKSLRGARVRVLLDYEIWDGEICSGEGADGTLLHKNSIYSEPLTLPRGDEL